MTTSADYKRIATNYGLNPSGVLPPTSDSHVFRVTIPGLDPSLTVGVTEDELRERQERADRIAEGRKTAPSTSEALLAARQAVEALDDTVWTRQADSGDWAISIEVRPYYDAYKRSGELHYNPELGGYMFRTFLWHGERTFDLTTVVAEIKQELIDAED